MDGADEAGTVASFLAGKAARYADRWAVVLDDDRLDYRAWDTRSAELAEGLLRGGVGKGTRIGILLGNGPDWLVTWTAITRIGAVAVPLSTLYSPTELADVIRTSDLAGLVHQDTYRNADLAGRVDAAVAALGDRRPESGAPPELVLPGAPYLRWVATTGAVRFGWQRSSASFGSAGDPATRALVAAAERQVVGSDDCLILFTSGTTSTPKGVIHSHDSLLSQVEAARRMLRFRDGTQVYCPLPYFWLAGQLHGLFPVLAAGGTSLCTESNAPSEVAALSTTYRLDRMYMVRSQYERLAASPDFARCDRSSVEIAFPTELLPPHVDPDEGSARVCADDRYMGLGMSETYGPYWFGPSITREPDPLNEQFPDVPPLTYVPPGFDVAILTEDGEPASDGETGEICVRGRGLMRTLNRRPASQVFDAGGYYHTGDLALVHGDRAYYRGRAGDVIKTAGASVSAAEVERAIERLVPVTRVCVVGIPDTRRGNVVAAVLVPANDEPVDTDALIGRLTEVISRYKVPRHILVLREDELPLTASSRIQRQALVELLSRQLRRDQRT